MKIIRILTACILLCCIMLSMTSCSNADNAVFPDGFEEYVPLLGIHTESVIPKLDPDSRFSEDYRLVSGTRYVSPNPVVFHGISFTESFYCYSNEDILTSFEYTAVLDNGSAAIAQTIWDLENHLVKYFGIPATNNTNSPLHQLTVEEIEGLLTEGKESAHFAQEWTLGNLVTDPAMAYLNYCIVQTSSSFLFYTVQPLPILRFSFSVTINGDGTARLNLYYVISYK